MRSWCQNKKDSVNWSVSNWSLLILTPSKGEAIDSHFSAGNESPKQGSPTLPRSPPLGFGRNVENSSQPCRQKKNIRTCCYGLWMRATQVQKVDALGVV